MLLCTLLPSPWVLKTVELIILPNDILSSSLSRHNMNSAINVLKVSVFKSRQQKNAITALGHFFTLVVQTIIFGTLASCHLFIHGNSGVATW